MGKTTKIWGYLKKSKSFFCLFLAVLLLAGTLPNSLWGENSNAAAESDNVSDYITWSEGTLEVDNGGEWSEIEADSESDFSYGNYRFTISWEADSERTYHAGEYFTFTVPVEFADIELDMVAEDETVVGIIHIGEKGNGTATFTDKVEKLTELSGEVSFEGTYSESEEDVEINWEFVFSSDVSYTYMVKNATSTEAETEIETDLEDSDTNTDSEVETETETETDSDDGDTDTESEPATDLNSSTTPPKLTNDIVGPDKSAEFEIDYLKVTIAGQDYEYGEEVDHQNTVDIDVYVNPRIDITLNWSQTTSYDSFVAGDYFSLKILEVSGSSTAYWANLTMDILLICEHGDTLGTGSLTGVRIDEDTVALYFTVVFTEYISEKQYIAGNFSGSATLMGLIEGNIVTFKTTGEAETVLDWDVTIITNPNAGKGSLGGKTSDSKSYKGSLGYDAARNEIRWRIPIRDLIYESFEDYKAVLAGGTIPAYEDLIFEDILDMHQTFAARYSPDNTSGRNFEIRMPLYLYDSKDNRVIEEGSIDDGGFYYSDATWTNIIVFMSLMTEITDTSDLTDPTSGVVHPTPEEYVRNVPRSFTIVTEEDLPNNPGYERERLIINFGAPGSTGLRYGEVMTGGVNGAETQYGSFAYALNRIKRLRDICDAVINNPDNQNALTNPDPSIQEELDKTEVSYTYISPTNSNDKTTYKYTWGEWKKWFQVYEGSYDYYNVWENGKLVGPYIYAFELDIITNIRIDQLETIKLIGSVKNSFTISGGFTDQGSSSNQTNKWSTTITAVVSEKGDAQIFKVDSLYGYTEGIKEDGNVAITGSMRNVEFEVYKSDGTGPLTFHYSGKYIYQSDGSGEFNKVETVYSDGSLILSRLPAGTYYLKEVSVLDGYYTGHTFEFTVNANESGYYLVNNYRRGVSLTKVDMDNEEITLPDATFELYQYTKDDFSDAKKITGFSKTTIGGTKYLVYGSGTDALTTGSDGKLNVVNLPAGKYYLKEVTAPDGYKLSDEKYNFELTEALKESAEAIVALGNITNKVQKVDFEFTFIKVDAADYDEQNPLPGAKFSLYQYTGEGEPGDDELVTLSNDGEPTGDWKEVDSYSTGELEEGRGISIYLESGIYQLVETKSPEGYQLPIGQWRFTVDAEAGTVSYLGIIAGNGATPNVREGVEHTGDNPMFLVGNVKSFTLPAAGGNGVYWFIALGGLCIAIGLVRFGYVYRRK